MVILPTRSTNKGTSSIPTGAMNMKKSITPRTALVDTLTLAAPASVITPVSSASLAALGLPSSTTLTPTVSKEVKKSVLKDRMGPSPLLGAASLTAHHIVPPPPRQQQQLQKQSEKNGSTKHRIKDPTCSAARTEIHHHSKSSTELLATPMTKVSYNKVDSIQPFPVSKSSNINIHVPTSSRPKTVADSLMVKPSPVQLPRIDQSIPAKIQSEVSKNSSSNKPPMASFVDSGMRWKETSKNEDDDDDITVLDLSEDPPTFATIASYQGFFYTL